MTYLLKSRRDDLMRLVSELKLQVASDVTLPEIKDQIINKKGYNEEETKAILHNITEERKRIEKQEENRQSVELQEKKEKKRLEELAAEVEEKRMQFELEKLKLEAQIKSDRGNITEKIKTPSEMLISRMRLFDGKEDISLYLTFFEQQSKTVSLPKEHWVSHLSNLLPADIVRLILREPEDKKCDYEHIKSLLLKRYKLTPEKFRQLFLTHHKNADETWTDFFYELQVYFDGWLSGLEITTFENLKDLIVVDQMKRRTPYEFKEYYLDEWSTITSPSEFAEKLEEFEDARKTIKPKSFGHSSKGKYEAKGSAKSGKSENNNDRRFENSKNENYNYRHSEN